MRDDEHVPVGAKLGDDARLPIRQHPRQGVLERFRGGQRRHVDIGITPIETRMPWVIQPQGRRRVNVHVRIEGNPNQRYPLLFRDYLRAHPNSARSIELIKREIVKRHAEDVEAYYDIKDPVYDLIWDAAQEWAKQTHWQPM